MKKVESTIHKNVNLTKILEKSEGRPQLSTIVHNCPHLSTFLPYVHNCPQFISNS